MTKSLSPRRDPPVEEPDTNMEKDDHVHLESLNIPGQATEEVAYTDEDAKRVLRKLDFWIMPLMMIAYGLQYWDKAISGQAVQFNFAADLDLIKVIGHDAQGNALTDTSRLANITLIFYIAYLVFAYPAALVSQRLPTAKVCAGAMFLWSIVVLSTPACSSYTGILINRFFLGLTECAIGPTFAVYITFWWTRQEQALRLNLWWGMTGVAGAITPFIAWGLGHVQGSFGDSTWKYMYFVAGAITLLWSIVLGICLPDDPKRAKWINERDRAIVIARVKENNAGLVDRRFKWSQIREALLDYNLWQSTIIAIGTNIPNTIFSSFSTVVIAGFGYSKFNSVLLLVPLGFTVGVTVYVTGWIATRYKNTRYYIVIVCALISMAGGLMSWLGPRNKPSVLYAGLVLMCFIISAMAAGVSLAASNCAGHTKKATMSGATFIGYCLGNIIGPICFQSTPGPVFNGGFISCVAFQAAVVVLACFGRWFMARENKRRDREYGPPGLSHALEDLTDRENKDFRYVL